MRKILLLFIIIFISFIVYASIELTVHYHRFDDNYEGWNLWIWDTGKEGEAYYFSETDDFGQVTRIHFDDDLSNPGIIVRLGNWEKKDITSDRFFEIKNGNAEIYLLQGVKDIFYEKPDTNPRIFFSAAVDKNEIRAFMTNKFDTKNWNGKINITIDGKNAEIVEVDKIIPTDLSETNFISVKLKKNLELNDLSKKIELIIDGFSPSEVIMMGILDYYYYEGELGFIYDDKYTEFRTWSPVSKKVSLLLYKNWDDKKPYDEIQMNMDNTGTWKTTVKGDLNGVFYLYKYNNYGTDKISVDSYSKAVAINSLKSAVIDLKKTDPDNWLMDANIMITEYPEDSIIYETHIADLTGNENSGIVNKASYLGMVEENGIGPNGVKTGFDHIKELGVTNIHIMPMYDFYTGNEENKDFEAYYNWGYDPYLFLVPEGRYSSNPFDPYNRIEEVKLMIKKFHENIIGIIIDIVFPHTYGTGELSSFDQAVPYYFYKISKDGSFINESGCGNTIASHRPMMRKFILDATEYWVEEYHVDGFRFDQMGFIDAETMLEVEKSLSKIKPAILIYGEGWGDATAIDYWGKPTSEKLPYNVISRLIKVAVKGTEIAAFNDDIRDGIRGSVFDLGTKGFIMDSLGKVKKIKSGLVGSINFSKTIKGFTDDPQQTINYAACHDNHTLWDKNKLAAERDSKYSWNDDELINAQKLAGAIILTSQGIPFINGAQDFARTKNFDGNSYNSPLSVNSFDYSRKAEYIEIFEYYKGLIELRKMHPIFRLHTDQEIIERVVEYETNDRKTIGFKLNGDGIDIFEEVIILFNGNNDETVSIALPEGTWNVVVNNNFAGNEILYSIEREVVLPPISAFVLYK